MRPTIEAHRINIIVFRLPTAVREGNRHLVGRPDRLVTGGVQRHVEHPLARLDPGHDRRVRSDLPRLGVDDLEVAHVAVDEDMYVMQAGVGRPEVGTRVQLDRERQAQLRAVGRLEDFDTELARAVIGGRRDVGGVVTGAAAGGRQHQHGGRRRCRQLSDHRSLTRFSCI